MDYLELDRMLKVMSDWIDDANAHRDPEAQTWGRLTKVCEESGEVVAAFIGATGQNPRKGVSHTMGDVQEELLDVALTALAAYHHLVQGNLSPTLQLEEHTRKRMKRVGLT